MERGEESVPHFDIQRLCRSIGAFDLVRTRSASEGQRSQHDTEQHGDDAGADPDSRETLAKQH